MPAANFLGRAKRGPSPQVAPSAGFFASQRDALNTRGHVFVRFQLPDGRIGSAKAPSVERAVEVIKLQYPEALLQPQG